MYLWAIYIFTRSICLFCCRKYVDRSWEYIKCSQTHECGNGTEAAQFPKKEHINRIFVAVFDFLTSWLAWPWPLRPWGHNHSCGTPNKKKLTSTDIGAKRTSKKHYFVYEFLLNIFATQPGPGQLAPPLLCICRQPDRVAGRANRPQKHLKLFAASFLHLRIVGQKGATFID
jgi:hypothetical protein